MPSPAQSGRSGRPRPSHFLARHVFDPIPVRSLVTTLPHIAVVDDEVDITRLLADYLSQNGYRVTQLQSGSGLTALMASDAPALVLLDLGLPGEDGLAIARHLRERWPCGLMIVSGRGEAVDKIVGLEIGADDYVTKPFDLRELLARIKAILRRTQPAVAPASQGDARRAAVRRFLRWTLDEEARSLTDERGREVPLTAGEFDLLHVFVSNAGRVLSREFLLEATRRREGGPFDRTIDVQVGRLRKKLEANADEPPIIRSVRGAGYLFVPGQASDP